MKKPFEVAKILIPIDFSETSLLALEHAALFCKKFKSKLHLLHVFRGSDIEILPDMSVSGSNKEEVMKKVTELLQEHGSELAEKHGVSYEVEIREGNVAKEVTRAARDAMASMIVMGTHGVSGFEEFFIGSNAYRVVTASELPVLTVQTHAKDISYKKILIGIDSTAHTRDKVSHTATIAKAFGAKIHISALITEEHETEKAIFNMKIKQIEEYLDRHEVEYDRDEVHGDDIADMLMDKAKEIDADLISIMTEQEAATGLFMGPYAQRIVNHSKVPVLSVTPFEIVDKFSQKELEGDYRPFHI